MVERQDWQQEEGHCVGRLWWEDITWDRTEEDTWRNDWRDFLYSSGLYKQKDCI